MTIPTRRDSSRPFPSAAINSLLRWSGWHWETRPHRPFWSVPRPYLLWFEAALAACLLIVVVYVKWHRPVRPERTIIAALPFENLTGDPKEDLFTDGLTEELISQLGSPNPDRLGVIGRTSVMRYKSGSHGIDQVGRDLRVDYILEGTVRAAMGGFESPRG